MSRLLLSSALVVLVFGLTLLACVPIEDELLPNIGDEMRITNDPEPNYDPRWYGCGDDENIDGFIPMTLSEASIAYHDGHSVFVYSLTDRSFEVIYSAPTGFEITTIDVLWKNLLIALHNGTDCKVIYLRDDTEDSMTLYEDQGVAITSIGGYPLDSGANLVFGREDGNVYYYLCETNSSDDYEFQGLLCEGCDVRKLDYQSYYFVSGSDTVKNVYVVYVTVYDGVLYTDITERLNNGYYNRYPEGEYMQYLSNADGDMDIWSIWNNVQVTNKPGDEIESDSTLEYIVFNRVEDGRSDIYVVRRDKL